MWAVPDVETQVVVITWMDGKARATRGYTPGSTPRKPATAFGAGHLGHAHFDKERICVPDSLHNICFTTLFLLRETGLIP